MEELHEVRLLGLPIAVGEAASAQVEALQREFHLIHEADADEKASVPSRLLALVAELKDRFGGFGDAQREQFYTAMTEGRSEIDLVYRVPAEVVAAARHLGEMLDEADEFCRRGEGLLTLASPPDAVAYRQWFLGQFIDQVAGAAPVSWADHRAATTAAPPAPADVDTAGFGGPDELATLSDDDGANVPLPAGWSLTVQDGTARLEVADDLDIESAPHLRAALSRLRQTGADHLDIDATRVTFLDSVGMSVLITGHLRFTEDGTDYTLAVSDEMRRTLEVSGLLTRLPVAN